MARRASRSGAVVGAGARVLGPVKVREGSAIGVNSVVTKGTPACPKMVGANILVSTYE
jgi:serine O-acetyltransferase